jgi:hypothetical protein
VPAYLKERDDALVSVRPVLELAPNFADLLALSLGERQELEGFGSRSANGRPLGDLQFLALVEHKLGRTVRRAKARPQTEASAALNGDSVSCPRIRRIRSCLMKDLTI